MAKRIRMRAKRLDRIDESKLALALWLLSRGLVEDATDAPADKPTGPRSDERPEARS